MEVVVRAESEDRRCPPATDRGQAALLVVLVAAALFWVAVTALVAVGRHTVERTRAQTVADSAALGGLAGGRNAASELADEHGADLVEFRVAADTGVVTVVVRVGGRTATASASDVVDSPLTGP